MLKTAFKMFLGLVKERAVAKVAGKPYVSYDPTQDRPWLVIYRGRVLAWHDSPKEADCTCQIFCMLEEAKRK